MVDREFYDWMMEKNYAFDDFELLDYKIKKYMKLLVPRFAWYLKDIDASIVSPRDDGKRKGKYLKSIEDILFYGKLLINMTPDMTGIEVYNGGKNGNDQYEYLLKDRAGNLYGPIDLKPVDNSDDLCLVAKFKKRTARRGFIKKFFWFRATIRKLLSADPLQTIPLRDGSTLPFVRFHKWVLSVPPNIYVDAVDRMNRALKWSIRDGDDPFLDPSSAFPVIEENLFDNRPTDGFDVLCPFDGYIHVLTAWYATPDIVWGIGGGRLIRLYVCPHCLLVFDSQEVYSWIGPCPHRRLMLV